ncbi:MAG: CaiB/BaiF CoA-transferase family protein [Steroidobacteraceae bacterium]|jgi:alpha-methylacyl-CoA racemase|nr:CaiB/BaiF CoA-transferase family protein [Steroidobacteraceae bacterium]
MALLQGLITLDLAAVGPAARASRILADYGMRVIKVAPVVGSGVDAVEPVFHAYGGGRGMQKIRVDLKSAAGRDVMQRLARRADVLIESFRPGVAQRLGLGFEDLKAHNPALVYCSTTGYGQQGPYSQWAGHDIDYLAVGGFLACSGRDAEGRPAMPGATVADSAGGGMHAAMSILAALVGRSRTGEGAYLDVSVVDGVLNLMSLYVDQYLATGEQTRPGSALLTGKFACYGVYTAGDGKHLAVGAIEKKFFRNLCRLLDIEHYADGQYDASRQDEIRQAMQQRFQTRTRDQWIELLADKDTCVAPVLEIAEAAADRHLHARRTFMTANHPEHGNFQQLAPNLAGQERDQPVYQLPPAGKLDTDAVLGEAGFSPDEIQQLRSSGSVQ